MTTRSEVHEIDPLEREEPVCADCKSGMDWVDCTMCADGYQGHDCGEDCCPCLNPEDNVVCDTCDGDNGWWLCERCARLSQQSTFEMPR